MSVTVGFAAGVALLAAFGAIDLAAYLVLGHTQTLSHQVYAWGGRWAWFPAAFLGGMLLLTLGLYLHFFGPRRPW